jgi:hypothetical protein
MTEDMRRPEDTVNQEKVARRLERRWNCFMHLSHGPYNEINYVTTRDHAWEVPLGQVEIKCRDILAADHWLTWLGLRKYHDLMRNYEKFGLTTLFVVGFENGDGDIHWIHAKDVDARHPVWRGRSPRPGDWEWMIEIPISTMGHIPVDEL